MTTEQHGRRPDIFGFTLIPYGLMDSQPDYKVWAVYACLFRHGLDSADGHLVSVATISLDTGICEKVVQRSLRTLASEGWIQIIREDGFPSSYFCRTQRMVNNG